jgi:hypothetical protein
MSIVLWCGVVFAVLSCWSLAILSFQFFSAQALSKPSTSTSMKLFALCSLLFAFAVAQWLPLPIAKLL